MDLGHFSISLTVQDLDVSQAFYEKLGFVTTGGSRDENYLILVGPNVTIGLFQGMFERNILTFNPGISPDGPVDKAMDVREIQARLDEAGIELTERVDPDTDGAGHIAFVDPDGNPILIDQFA